MRMASWTSCRHGAKPKVTRGERGRVSEQFMQASIDFLDTLKVRVVDNGTESCVVSDMSCCTSMFFEIGDRRLDRLDLAGCYLSRAGVYLGSFPPFLKYTCP